MLDTIIALLSGRAQWSQVGPVLIGITLALVAGITFHEFGHALVAYRLGDPTPKRMGRVTLNPSAHIDPMGAIIFFLAGFAALLLLERLIPYAPPQQKKSFRVLFHLAISIANSVILYFVITRPFLSAVPLAGSGNQGLAGLFGYGYRRRRQG